MAIPRNLANLANQLNTDGEVPKIEVGDSKVEVTDTGSNGTIVFNTDGSERMRVTSAGRLGIGTTSPLDKLNVQADSTTSPSSGNLAPFIVSGATSSNKRLLVGFNTTDNQGYVQAVEHTVDYRALTLNPQGGAVLVNKTTTTANGGDLQISSGITFPATQAAKSDANTLDDYEEGTWTLTMVASGATFGDLGTSARYIKIGRSVTVYGYIQRYVTAGGGANAVTITGLPFTAQSGITVAGGQAIMAGFVDNTNGFALGFRVSANTTTVDYLKYINDSGTTKLDTVKSTDLTNANHSIQFSFCYLAAS